MTAAQFPYRNPSKSNTRLRAPSAWTGVGNWEHYVETINTFWDLTENAADFTDSMKLQSMFCVYLSEDMKRLWIGERASLQALNKPADYAAFTSWAKIMWANDGLGPLAKARWDNLTQDHGTSTIQFLAKFRACAADVQATCTKDGSLVLSDQLQAMHWLKTCKSGQVQHHALAKMPTMTELAAHSQLNPLPTWRVYDSEFDSPGKRPYKPFVRFDVGRLHKRSKNVAMNVAAAEVESGEELEADPVPDLASMDTPQLRALVQQMQQQSAKNLLPATKQLPPRGKHQQQKKPQQQQQQPRQAGPPARNFCPECRYAVPGHEYSCSQYRDAHNTPYNHRGSGGSRGGGGGYGGGGGHGGYNGGNHRGNYQSN